MKLFRFGRAPDRYDRRWFDNLVSSLERFLLPEVPDQNGNLAIRDTALATSATDGFIYIPTVAGKPTGTPRTYTGQSPLVIDTTNGRLYAYYGSAWHHVDFGIDGSAAPTGVSATGAIGTITVSP